MLLIIALEESDILRKRKPIDKEIDFTDGFKANTAYKIELSMLLLEGNIETCSSEDSDEE
ncbi:hypothetical protein [Bacteroides ihuae]|uniref:hypothetical protein n=1 Tax=Bacteroides ihuae TaxID=1852362 RepID=UPI0011148B5D|nr:hypothetical protein [Bacteroides ihuae]